MEGSIFPKPEVAAQLKKYVEVRLHTDLETPEAARFQEYKLRLTRSAANPIYVVVDPEEPEKVLDRFDGADLTKGVRFAEFLEKNAK